MEDKTKKYIIKFSFKKWSCKTSIMLLNYISSNWTFKFIKTVPICHVYLILPVNIWLSCLVTILYFKNKFLNSEINKIIKLKSYNERSLVWFFIVVCHDRFGRRAMVLTMENGRSAVDQCQTKSYILKLILVYKSQIN